MSAVKVKERKRSVLLAVLFLALVCYFVAVIISNNSKAKALENQNAQAVSVEQSLLDENAKMSDFIEDADEEEKYELIAREQGYAYPDEIVYNDSAE